MSNQELSHSIQRALQAPVNGLSFLRTIKSRRGGDLVEACKILKQKGWSYRRVAPELGVTYQHLSDVLNGHRISRRLLDAISALPETQGSSR
jgi:hypothetical protein